MKLATYHDGSRDGQLVVVARDLATAQFASGAATRLQQALDDWNFVAPQLEALYEDLNHGRARRAFAFDPARCMAPLPRSPEWLLADARPDAAGDAPPHLVTGSCNTFAGAWSVAGPYPDTEVDFGAGLAVVTADVAAGADADTALAAVRLVMLACDIRLDGIAARERRRGDAPLLSRPRVAFSPVALTPDEFGAAWRDGRLALRLDVTRGERAVARRAIDAGMPHGFGTLVAQACSTRALGAGTVVGTGALTVAERARGYTCIAHQRAAEAADDGAAATPWLRAGESISVDMKGPNGRSACGRIVQTVGGGPADDLAGLPGRAADAERG